MLIRLRPPTMRAVERSEEEAGKQFGAGEACGLAKGFGDQRRQLIGHQWVAQR